jgi:DNA topoisomerase-3
MIRILYLTEKASVGRALANVLPGEKKKEPNHIRCRHDGGAGDDVVAWASGHLLELFEPQDYDECYSKWRLDTLPIIPEHWKLKEIPRTRNLLKNIGELLKEAESVVHAGDLDREGQCLIDEILEYFVWTGPTKRLLINDVNPDAIQKALKEMKDNQHYRHTFFAGKARSYADWASGVNLTRWCTLSAENAGYDLGGKVLSVGRVQTPTLGLVVRRDREIEHFVSRPYYVLSATLTLDSSLGSAVMDRKIVGRWKPRSSESQPEGDKSSEIENDESPERLMSEEARKALLEKIRGRGEITGVDKKVHRKTPPLPYSLPKLQMDASRLYDITDTLTHAQTLYERGYLSYPRTDCPYLPEGHHAQATLILDAIGSACPDLQDLLTGVDATRKSPAWSDSKVKEHHALAPTVKVPLKDAISDVERKIYDLVARRYALQFLPDCEYEETTVEFSAGGEIFKASGRIIIVPGWTRWDKGNDTKDQEILPAIPSVSVGESGEAEPLIEEKKTTSPKRFTYDTLLGAMNSIHLYVQDPQIRKQLKDLDGIGTAATQANILALLFERGYIEKMKKQIFSTPLGNTLIDLLSAGKSAMFVTPDLTALWEQEMARIENGEIFHEIFVGEVGAMVGEIVKEPLNVPEMCEFPKRKKCLTEGCDGYLNRRKYMNRRIGAGDFYFSCPVCKHVFYERDGELVAAPVKTPGEVVEADCPLGCGKKARRFDGKYGPFWKCFCSPNVKFKDVDGKPAVPEKRPPAVTAKCPVKKCKGTAVQHRAKIDGHLFWKCETCKNFFDDDDGKLVIREKQAKSGRS